MKKLLLVSALMISFMHIKSMNDIDSKVFFGAGIATGIFGIGSLFFSKHAHYLADLDDDIVSLNYKENNQSLYWHLLKDLIIQKKDSFEIPEQFGNETDRLYIQRVVLKNQGLLESFESQGNDDRDLLAPTIHFAKKDQECIQRKSFAQKFFNGGIVLLLASISSLVGGYFYSKKDHQEV